jgi:hypothetical protein
VCAVLAVAAAIWLPGLAGPDNAALVETSGAQTNRPLSSGGASSAAESDAVFSGFVLTTYRPAGGAEYLSADFEEEAERLTLTPDVMVALASYSPLMSCVPGLPFTIDQPDGSSVDTIRVSVDSGALCEWDQTTGIVTERGASAEIAAGGTVYWNPFGETKCESNDITMTVEAVLDGAVAGRQEIHIIQDESGGYCAVIGEPETL